MPLFDSLSTNKEVYFRLSKNKAIPTTEDLRYALDEAKKRNKPVELPFEHPHNNQTFIVRIQLGFRSAPPIWTHLIGDGPSARVLWTRPSNEILMIQNKIKTESARGEHENAAQQSHVDLAPQNAPLPFDSLVTGRSAPPPQSAGQKAPVNPFLAGLQAEYEAQEAYQQAYIAQQELEASQMQQSYQQEQSLQQQQELEHLQALEHQQMQASKSAFGSMQEAPAYGFGQVQEAPPLSEMFADMPQPAAPPATSFGAAPTAVPFADAQFAQPSMEVPQPAAPSAAAPLAAAPLAAAPSAAAPSAAAPSAAAPAPAAFFTPPAQEPPPNPAAPAAVPGRSMMPLPAPFPLDWNVVQQVQAQLTDTATGFFSFKTFVFFLLRSWDAFQKDRTPFSAVLFEIAIRYPDGQTVPLPPEALQPLSGRLKSACTSLDIMACIGSGEFVVLLPSTNSAAATEFCQRLHQVLSDTPLLPDATGRDLAFISIGAANLPETSSDPAVVVAAAEEAKEMAKQSKIAYMLFP